MWGLVSHVQWSGFDPWWPCTSIVLWCKWLGICCVSYLEGKLYPMATSPYCKLWQFLSQSWHLFFCNPNYLLVGGYLGCYGSCVFIGNGSLFSIFLLCRIMDMAYWMAMMLISSNVYLMLTLRILNVVSILSIEGVCVAALALAVMTINKSTFHPLLIILSISGLYFSFWI